MGSLVCTPRPQRPRRRAAEAGRLSQSYERRRLACVNDHLGWGVVPSGRREPRIAPARDFDATWNTGIPTSMFTSKAPPAHEYFLTAGSKLKRSIVLPSTLETKFFSVVPEKP